MSQHNYTRAIVDGYWGLRVHLLSHEVIAVLPGKSFTISANGTSVVLNFTETLTAGEITTLDTAVSDHQTAFDALSPVKATKIIDIDTRTAELIDLGFTYASKQFSLSIPAQSKMMGTHQVKDNPALVYPINWNTIDDLDSYSIVNSADLDGFYLTALGTVRAHLDSGTVVKDSVRAATTIAEVDAVVDTR